MERKLKERLVGATVIVALGIIIIPWLLDGPAQAPRPVETAIELPPVESPGRTYTIPLDPGAGPPVQIDNETRQTNGAGAGAVQRPAPTEPAPLDFADGDSAPAGAEQAQSPAVTCCCMRFDEMGRVGVQELVRQRKTGRRQADVRRVGFDLIAGQTAAPPGGDDSERTADARLRS